MIAKPAHATMDFEEFCERFVMLTGFRLDAYKRNQMERRTRAYAQRQGMATLEAFWLQLSDDVVFRQRYLDFITINVTEFFREAKHFHEVMDYVLPRLFAQSLSPFIWSAGCAGGMEAYSVKMLLQERDPVECSRLWGTDVDLASLTTARLGRYSLDALATVPEELRVRYFTCDEQTCEVKPVLRQGVDFLQLDLLVDRFPTGVDLILCRNVVIYFNAEHCRRLYEHFLHALRPGGYLFLGNSERMLHAAEIGFTSPLPHLYQRPR